MYLFRFDFDFCNFPLIQNFFQYEGDKLPCSKVFGYKAQVRTYLAFKVVFDSFFVFLTVFSFYGLAFIEDHDTLCLTLTMLCCSVDCESAFSFNSNYFKQSNQSREKCFR